MERLTELHHKKSDGYYIRCSEHCNNDICDCGCEKFDQIVNRLGAYEDTGLEPDAVEHLKLASMGKSVAEITEFDGIPIDRLRELAKADRMIGKEVWAQAKYLNIFQTKPSLIQRTTIQYVSLLKGGDILCHTQTCAFPLNEIGKTVFLTREEAETALKEGENGGT